MSQKGTRFLALSEHPWYGRLFKKLKKNDIDFCLKFLIENEANSKDNTEFLINRVFLDKVKPRAWKEMAELLSASNK